MATKAKSTTPKTKTVTVGEEKVKVPKVDTDPKPKVDAAADTASNPAKTDETNVNASAPVGQVNPVPAGSQDDDAATASNVELKAAAETYTRVFRIPAPERHSKKLPEGFPDDDYARATVREAIQHGWRVEDGVLASRGKVTFADPGEYNIDIPYTVEVFSAAGAPATLPVGETLEETTEAQPNTGNVGDQPN